MKDSDLYKLVDEFLDWQSVPGKLFWKKDPGKKRLAGKEAGAPHSEGYWTAGIGGKTYLRSWLVFLMFNRHLPKKLDIEHRDLNRSNDHPDNLRVATRSENMFNMRKHRDNTTGFKGVYRSNHAGARNPFFARICVNYKIIHLGVFPTAEEASAAYQRAAKARREGFARFE